MADPLTLDAGPAPRRLAPLVVARGAAWGLLLAVPGALVNAAAAGGGDGSERSSGVVALSFLVVLVGFGVAGFTAGVEAPTDRVRHGVLAALVALVPVELVAVLGRLDRDAGVSLPPILFTAAFAVAVGYVGSRLAGRVPERPRNEVES